MSSTSTLILRPATSEDLPSIVQLDIAANPSHPLINTPWANPGDAYTVFFPRYELFFSAPYMHFLVAEVVKNGGEKEIVGFATWKYAGDHVEPDFNPIIPESANGALIGYLVGELESHKKGMGVQGLAELEQLGVAPEYQRQGVGAAILKSVLEGVDKRGEKMFVNSSEAGKGLYEKFGWKTYGRFGEVRFDLSEFGIDKPYITWDMMRDVGGA